jgi:hypothetical protein
MPKPGLTSEQVESDQGPTPHPAAPAAMALGRPRHPRPPPPGSTDPNPQSHPTNHEPGEPATQRRGPPTPKHPNTATNPATVSPTHSRKIEGRRRGIVVVPEVEDATVLVPLPGGSGTAFIVLRGNEWCTTDVIGADAWNRHRPLSEGRTDECRICPSSRHDALVPQAVVRRVRGDRGCGAGSDLEPGGPYVHSVSAFVVDFWRDTRVTAPSRFITADILMFALAAGILMVTEARRHNVKFVWAYIVGAVLIAGSVAFPLQRRRKSISAPCSISITLRSSMFDPT